MHGCMRIKREEADISCDMTEYENISAASVLILIDFINRHGMIKKAGENKRSGIGLAEETTNGCR